MNGNTETPFSIQQVTDVNERNLFAGIKDVLKKQIFLCVPSWTRCMTNCGGAPTTPQPRIARYLGNRLLKAVRKTLPQLHESRYAASMNYMRAGVPIVLQPDEAYLQKFKDGNPHGFLPSFFWSLPPTRITCLREIIFENGYRHLLKLFQKPMPVLHHDALRWNRNVLQYNGWI